MNFLEFNEMFPTEDSCLEFLMEQQDHTCTCGSKKWYRRKGRASYACGCGKEFYPRKNTIFNRSRVPLKSWFFIIFLFSNSKNGLSGAEIKRHIGVTTKTAWRMGMKIRRLMKEEFAFTGTIEADETGIGGKGTVWKTNWSDAKKKDLVFGIAERGGKTMMKQVPSRDVRDLVKHFRDVSQSCTLYTDGLFEYRTIAKYKKIHHEHVNHTNREWSRNEVSTNTIEAHWSHLKSFLWGTHRGVSKKYLQFYLDERCHATNHPEGRFDLLLSQLTSVDA